MIKEFTIGCSRTINLGNFESARIEASLTFNMESHPPIDLPAIKDAMQVELRSLLEQTWKEQIKKRKETTTNETHVSIPGERNGR